MCKKDPRVSIGLPVYNGEKFLKNTLDSILSQTFKEFELIISDNASTDSTERICRMYMSRDSRIRYYRNESNMGASWNYNRVFALSSGEYFKWAADDDLCAPEMIQRCVDVLDQYPDVVVCHSKTRIIDEHGKILRDDDNVNSNLLSESPRERFIKSVCSLVECNAVFGLIRSCILKQTPLIGNFISSDTCLLAEVSLYGKFYEIPDYMFFRRTHPGASSSNKEISYQLQFFDPQKKTKVVLPWWRRRYENYISVIRAPIKMQEKFFLFGFLTFKTLHWHKLFFAELQLAIKQLIYKLWYKIFRNQFIT